MPRQARKKSNSGYLHLIVRGIGRQVIFEDSQDYQRYLSFLERFSAETSITVCAYCLMENHVHLLIKDNCDGVSLFMKKLGVCYAGYFNKKYDRCGHLFQDRYLSEAVEDDAYLLAVFRYILNNPQKAGICPAESYPWSSYALYDEDNTFIDCSLLRELIGGRERFSAFMAEESRESCLEYDGKRDEEWARERLCRLLDVSSGLTLQTWDRAARNEALRLLKKEGLSVRQIERLTGINRNVIQRV